MLPIAVILLSRSASAESITVDGRPVEVVGRRAIPLEEIQKAADEYPTWLESATSSLYFDRGYAAVKVTERPTELVIDEGPRMKFRNVKAFEDGTKTPLRLQHVRSGRWFSRNDTAADVRAIESSYRDAGFAFAMATPTVTLDVEAKRIDLQIIVEPGPVTTIDSVTVLGNVRVSDDVIKRRVSVTRGQRYNESALMKTKSALEELGAFTEIAVSTRQVPGHADRIAVTFEVTEP